MIVHSVRPLPPTFQPRAAAPAAPDVYSPAQDRDWEDAGALMKARGIPAARHEFMRENLATYLSHRTRGIASARWQNKIDRELASPYTDDQVLKHVDELQASLLENLQALPVMPSKVFITGSFSRGRLGGNSDLDGFAVLPKEQVGAGFAAFEGRADEQGANVFPLSESSPGYNRAQLMMAGASVAITPDQLLQEGFLRDTYVDVLMDRTSHGRRETSAVYEWATGKIWREGLTPAEKRAAFEGGSLGKLAMNWTLSLGGTLSAVPLLGAVIRGVAHLMVRQDHRDVSPAPTAGS